MKETKPKQQTLHGSSNVMYLKMAKFLEEVEEEKWEVVV